MKVDVDDAARPLGKTERLAELPSAPHLIINPSALHFVGLAGHASNAELILGKGRNRKGKPYTGSGKNTRNFHRASFERTRTV